MSLSENAQHFEPHSGDDKSNPAKAGVSHERVYCVFGEACDASSDTSWFMILAPVDNAPVHYLEKYRCDRADIATPGADRRSISTLLREIERDVFSPWNSRSTFVEFNATVLKEFHCISTQVIIRNSRAIARILSAFLSSSARNAVATFFKTSAE